MCDLRQEAVLRDGVVLPAVLGSEAGGESVESLVKHLVWLLSMFSEAERVLAIRRLLDAYCPVCGRVRPCGGDE